MRIDTSRPNFRYVVKDRETPRRLVTDVAFVVPQEVREATLGGEKMMMYTSSRELCDRIEGAVKCLAIGARCFANHSGKEESEKWHAQQAWASNDCDGKLCIMLECCVFGCQIDVGAVRTFVHSEQSRRLVQFAQEWGQPVRDGKEALSLVQSTNVAGTGLYRSVATT